MSVTLGAAMLENMLTKKIAARVGREYNNMDQMDQFLIPLHHLNNFEITKYFKYQPRFNGVYSTYYFPVIKYEVCIINLDGKQSKRTQ